MLAASGALLAGRLNPAAALLNRIGAGTSFDGGAWSDKPGSLHLFARKIKARIYFGIASNDDRRQLEGKDRLREVLVTEIRGTVEVFGQMDGAREQPPR